VGKIAIPLPEPTEEEDHFAFSVNNRGMRKGIAWVWMERVHPKKVQVPNPEGVAIRVRDNQEKEKFLASDPSKFFTVPHYNGFPAILVRLAAVDVDELRHLTTNAWQYQAPPAPAKNIKGSKRL
jgi:hypothetical protein